HPFSAAFARRLRAATQRATPRFNPRHTVDIGRIVSVSGGHIVVRQEPLFHVARTSRHARSLYSVRGLARNIERVVISPHTLVSTPGSGGRVIRHFGATAGLRRGAVVV